MCGVLYRLDYVVRYHTDLPDNRLIDRIIVARNRRHIKGHSGDLDFPEMNPPENVCMDSLQINEFARFEQNLYDIERGVTMTLIGRGFHAEFLIHGSTNKPTPYVINLLRDQEEAFEGVMDFVAKSRHRRQHLLLQIHRKRPALV